jgi:hypothetical protein
MADLLFKRPDYTLDTITLDAVLTESHSSDSEITDHPVEKGVDVSDHVRPKPVSVKLDCVISDDVIDLAGQKSSHVEGRSRDIYAKIERLKENGTQITVTTQLKRYDALVIGNLSPAIDGSTVGAVKFSISLREVRTVESQIVPVRAIPKARKKVDLGKKTGTGASDATTNESQLHKLGHGGIQKATDLFSSLFKG